MNNRESTSSASLLGRGQQRSVPVAAQQRAALLFTSITTMSSEANDVPNSGLAALLQQSRDAVFVLNRHRRIRFVNRAWERLTGRNAADVLGMTCTRRQTAQALAIALCPPKSVREGAVECVRRTVPPNPSGPPWWDIWFVPLLGEAGLVGILGRITLVAAEEVRPTLSLPDTLRQRLIQRASRYGFDRLWSETSEMLRNLALARLAAKTYEPLWISGESGSGKQTFARVVHHQGITWERPFVLVDCAGLPPLAIRQILFGPAGIDHAEPPGTLYLRQPHQMPLDVQSHLVDWWSDQDAPRVRVVVGTSSDLRHDLDTGRILETFYTAFGILEVRLPSLRQRPADLPALVQQVLRRIAQHTDSPVVGISNEALDVLREYDWPGNLRELAEVLTDAVEQSAGQRIVPDHLPLRLRRSVREERFAQSLAGRIGLKPLASLDVILETVERKLLTLALHRCKGNKTEAAQWLGIWRTRLLRRIEALGLQADSAQEE